ncbi:protein yellow-like [Cloeon dipterum]|uniref:protein yellow-like n=1 Tax=Cloeon dipterum TaxID=197152 RepID=UPI00322086F6
MDLFCFVIVLLHVSLATTADFSQVFKWQDELDYEWPSEKSRTHALKVGTFKPSNFEPRYMAVSRTRIFLSLFRTVGISVTLVSLPTSSASSAPPKLTPFPSWDMHGYGDCNKIERARGLEMDSVGRLWVLDSGSEKCDVKLWIFDLFNNDRTKLVHRFTIQKWMHDLVLDETPNGYFAYIVRWEEEHIVVFSLERNQSWNVYTAGIKAFSIAVSPKSRWTENLLAD